MTKKLAARSLTLAALLTTTISAAQAATMLGDTLAFLRAYPNVSTPYAGWTPNIVSTIAVAGSSDLIDWTVGAFHTIIDPEANSIDIRFPVVSAFSGAVDPFDGFLISGFSHDITSASVLTNTSGLTATVTHSAREIALELDGPNLGGTTGLVLSVTFADASAVAEPASSTIALAAIIGAAILRRRSIAAA